MYAAYCTVSVVAYKDQCYLHLKINVHTALSLPAPVSCKEC